MRDIPTILTIIAVIVAIVAVWRRMWLVAGVLVGGSLCYWWFIR